MSYLQSGLLTGIICTQALFSAAAQPSDVDNIYNIMTVDQQRQLVDRAFPLHTALWPKSSHNDHWEIFVCWENLSDSSDAQRLIIKEAVDASWLAHSDVRFLGWDDPCTKERSGIRIAVRDTTPHTKALGRFLDRKPEGMVLNFTFQQWGKDHCVNRIQECAQTVAIHEFGHALGFAHEQKRPDTPDDCKQSLNPSQITSGTAGDDADLTPWDKDSVMNYCNAVYLNNGKLSDFDRFAVSALYSEPLQ